MEFLPTFTINLGEMKLNIPYMEHLGMTMAATLTSRFFLILFRHYFGIFPRSDFLNMRHFALDCSQNVAQ